MSSRIFGIFGSNHVGIAAEVLYRPVTLEVIVGNGGGVQSGKLVLASPLNIVSIANDGLCRAGVVVHNSVCDIAFFVLRVGLAILHSANLLPCLPGKLVLAFLGQVGDEGAV